MKLVDVKKNLEKNLTENTLQSGDALIDVNAPRLKTGVLVFDVIMGGGLPLGKFNVFWGDKSSGKSTMALRVAGSFQKAFPNQSVVWCDMENAYEDKWAKNYIGDPRRFHLIRPDFGEQAVDLFCEMMEAEDAGLGIFDSLGSLYSQKESDGDAADKYIAHQAILVNRMTMKLAPILTRSAKQGKAKGMIFINQARASFGGASFGPTTRPTGGKMLGHIVSTTTHFYLKEVKKVGGLPTFSTHTFTLDKNRMGLSRRSGDFSFYMRPFEGRSAGELEESKTILSLGRDSGVIAKVGTAWTVLGKKYDKLTDVQELINSDEKVRNGLKEAILKHCLTNQIVVGEDAKDE